jgi:hypothetical protein
MSKNGVFFSCWEYFMNRNLPIKTFTAVVLVSLLSFVFLTFSFVSALAQGKAPKPTAGEPREEPAREKLELLAYTWRNTPGVGCVVEGQVKNISGEPMENVEAVVTFLDKDGDFAASETAATADDPIPPGKTTTFKATHAKDKPAYKGVKVEFKFFAGALIPTRHSEKRG